MPRERRTEGECGKDRDSCMTCLQKGWRGSAGVGDVHGEKIRQVKKFKYLGTVLCEGGGSSRDVRE